MAGEATGYLDLAGPEQEGQQTQKDVYGIHVRLQFAYRRSLRQPGCRVKQPG
jgi:hypothetical protein